MDDRPVMVTGCAGFIGAAVTTQLLEAGQRVVGVDSLNEAYDPRLKLWRLDQLKGRRGFDFHQVDVAQGDALGPLFAEPPRAVINLAARAGVRQSVADPWVYLDTNARGTLNLLEQCRRRDVRTFLLASTSSLYGQHNAVPFREDASTDLPLSPYAASKKAAEALAATYHHLHGLDASVLRYFTVYGPAGRPDMSVFRFVRWIAEGEPVVLYGDGSQRRDFTYVDDIARGTIAAIELRGHEVVNLGGDRPVTMARLLELVELALGKRARIDRRPAHRADMDATWADIGKARALLGWAPQVPLEEGLLRTVAWYLENRAWAREVGLGEA